MSNVALLLLSLLPQDRATPEPPWRTERLDNGVRIHVAGIASAKRFAVLSFLPVGLDGDPIGRAQFAHLAEHMMIRSTDKSRLQVGAMALNGETTSRVMRLESFAPPEQWKGALTRHARWLTARTFDAATLTREKVKIEGEERGTVHRGYNHKWATAAWSQLVRGTDHAAVHGDVAGATVEQIQRYIADRVRLDQAQIFVTGPVDARQIFAALRAEFRKIDIPDSAPTTSSTKAATPEPDSTKPVHREATWDLQASHYLEWYELPADCTAAEAELLSQVLTMSCYQHRFFRDIPGRAVASSVTYQGKRFVLLSTNLPADAELAEVQAALRAAVKRASRFAVARRGGDAMANRFVKRPDFVAQRKRIENPRLRGLVEANWAMQCGYASTRLGLSIDAVPAAYRRVRGGRIAAILAKGCGPGARHSARVLFAEKRGR
jgi:predicted Zn-dependent peptidase